MRKIVIAIDGYSSCGKSTTAKLVALQLNYTFIDTGAMYRAVAFYLLQNGIRITDTIRIIRDLPDIHLDFRPGPVEGKRDIYLNGICVEDKIRTMEVANIVSEVSAIREVREAMVKQQKKMGDQKGVVMDGRDIGTVVFPDAELKIFMTASVEERVKRRKRELLKAGVNIPEEEVRSNLLHRDFVDTTRKESPLTKAPDAIILDTSEMSINEQVQWVLDEALSKTGVNQLS